jgi:hypothetical protein
LFAIDKLYNYGIKIIGDNSLINEEKKTLIVIGVARSGTSLLEGTLYHLGVFCGDKCSSPVFEDIKLASAFEKNNLKEAEKIINEYNERFNIWSFKRPAAINYISRLHSMVRNPIYLFIFKDIFSIANRNNISMNLDIIHSMKKAHDDYSKILTFILNNKINGFLFSYEKIMSNKNFFIDTLIKIIGKEKIITNNQIENALKFIQPNPKEYIDKSRITKGIGRIDIIAKRCIKGWAKYIYIDKPAEVELYINDKLIDKSIANNFRQDLLKIHKTGCCAFEFKLKEPLKDGDKVSVKIKNDIGFLNNSNFIFKENVEKEK